MIQYSNVLFFVGIWKNIQELLTQDVKIKGGVGMIVVSVKMKRNCSSMKQNITRISWISWVAMISPLNFKTVIKISLCG